MKLNNQMLNQQYDDTENVNVELSEVSDDAEAVETTIEE